jgi:hypothetical protein
MPGSVKQPAVVINSILCSKHVHTITSAARHCSAHCALPHTTQAGQAGGYTGAGSCSDRSASAAWCTCCHVYHGHRASSFDCGQWKAACFCLDRASTRLSSCTTVSWTTVQFQATHPCQVLYRCCVLQLQRTVQRGWLRSSSSYWVRVGPGDFGAAALSQQPTRTHLKVIYLLSFVCLPGQKSEFRI